MMLLMVLHKTSYLFVGPHTPKANMLGTKMQSFSDLFLELIISNQLCAGKSLMTSSLEKKVCKYMHTYIYYTQIERTVTRLTNMQNKICKTIYSKFCKPVTVIYYFLQSLLCFHYQKWCYKIRLQIHVPVLSDSPKTHSCH